MTTETGMVETAAESAFWAYVAAEKRELLGTWEMVREEKKEVWRAVTRAVLECLRTPTPEMEYVGGTKLENMMFGGDEEYTGVIFTDVGVVFRDMIDAALSPNPTSNGELE